MLDCGAEIGSALLAYKCCFHGTNIPPPYYSQLLLPTGAGDPFRCIVVTLQVPKAIIIPLESSVPCLGQP